MEKNKMLKMTQSESMFCFSTAYLTPYDKSSAIQNIIIVTIPNFLINKPTTILYSRSCIW